MLVAQSCLILLRPHGLYVPLSMAFSTQEYWSRLPFPSPGDLPDLGIEPRSPALQADSLPAQYFKSNGSNFSSGSLNAMRQGLNCEHKVQHEILGGEEKRIFSFNS